MLAFKNYIDQQKQNEDDNNQKQILALYLNYIEWLIEQLREKPDAKQEYTTTELLVQLRLMGEYCQAEQRKITPSTPLLDNPPWYESHVADVRANMPAMLRNMDECVHEKVREHQTANNAALATSYQRKKNVWNVLLLGTFVLSFIPKSVLALPIPGYGIDLMLGVFTIGFALASLYSRAMADAHRSQIVTKADEFNEGHTSYHRIVMKQPFLTGFTHEPMAESLPTLVNNDVSLFNIKRAGVDDACKTITTELEKHEDVIINCTLSSMVTNRYKNLYSNYDQYKALEPPQFAQYNLGDDKPADLEDVARNLRAKMSCK